MGKTLEVTRWFGYSAFTHSLQQAILNPEQSSLLVSYVGLNNVHHLS